MDFLSWVLLTIATLLVITILCSSSDQSVEEREVIPAHMWDKAIGKQLKFIRSSHGQWFLENENQHRYLIGIPIKNSLFTLPLNNNNAFGIKPIQIYHRQSMCDVMIQPQYAGHMFQIEQASPNGRMIPATTIFYQQHPQEAQVFRNAQVLLDIRNEKEYVLLRKPIEVNVIMVDMGQLSVSNAERKLTPIYEQTYMAARYCNTRDLWLSIVDFPLPIVVHTINKVHAKYGQGMNVRLFDRSGYCISYEDKKWVTLSVEGYEKFQTTCPNVGFSDLRELAPSAIIF
jgi:hypothetical protein